MHVAIEPGSRVLNASACLIGLYRTLNISYHLPLVMSYYSQINGLLFDDIRVLGDSYLIREGWRGDHQEKNRDTSTT